jgi:hypothetical protein
LRVIIKDGVPVPLCGGGGGIPRALHGELHYISYTTTVNEKEFRQLLQ